MEDPVASLWQNKTAAMPAKMNKTSSDPRIAQLDYQYYVLAFFPAS